ncbi:hypothetical protein PV772_22325 [Pseudarthrobacter sp. CC12]|uniref:hypothetical protein n=1 Tax=Pseudarthrobacter sp. CC12 TaxID=3029193 RepID=UPI003265AE32
MIGQGDGAADAGTTDAGSTDGTTGTAPAPTSTGGVTDAAGALNGNLLNVDVNLDADAAIAAPINGAVAANANVAAPIDAAVAANIGSIDSQAPSRTRAPPSRSTSTAPPTPRPASSPTCSSKPR